MNYHHATYILSVHNIPQLPPDEGAEVAFAGRSNAGKSSAINALTGQRALARVSKTPGRTQQLNFFRIDDTRRLVDLPGYGYAKVPLPLKRHWHQLVETYLRERECLRGLVLLMDIRHPLTDFDQGMLAWRAETDLPAQVVLTKADKLSRGAAIATLKQVEKALAGQNCQVQLFSVPQKQGIEQLQQRLDEWLQDEPADEPAAAEPAA